tara:strand:- start:1367 stop:2002 length:636 start_codon:yes stop_codon:yes gene_type:complete
MEELIKQTLSRTICTGWDRGFLESILEQLAKGRQLSSRQREMLEQVMERNDEESQIAHEQWENIYLENHAAEARALSVYYLNTGYWTNLAKSILDGEVPDYRAYHKMSNNKYAKKVLAELAREPKYPVGSYLLPRASFDSYKHCERDPALAWAITNQAVEHFKSRGGFVIEVCEHIKSAAAGAKRYKLLPIGYTTPLIVEERFLKISRRKS